MSYHTRVISKFSFVLVPAFLVGFLPIAGLRGAVQTPTTLTQTTEQPAVQVLPAPFPEVEEYQVKKVIRLTVTAYSSTVDQTDSDPFTTASGSKVHDGTLAHNFLPFGTRVRFPDIFGDKVFVVEDRLHPGKGYYIADLWVPSRDEAKQWGARVLKMEILGVPKVTRS